MVSGLLQNYNCISGSMYTFVSSRIGRIFSVAAALPLLLLLLGGSDAAAADRCPRPDEIAPCQCRTRGPAIQVRFVTTLGTGLGKEFSTMRIKFISERLGEFSNQCEFLTTSYLLEANLFCRVFVLTIGDFLALCLFTALINERFHTCHQMVLIWLMFSKPASLLFSSISIFA